MQTYIYIFILYAQQILEILRMWCLCGLRDHTRLRQIALWQRNLLFWLCKHNVYICTYLVTADEGRSSAAEAVSLWEGFYTDVFVRVEKKIISIKFQVLRLLQPSKAAPICIVAVFSVNSLYSLLSSLMTRPLERKEVRHSCQFLTHLPAMYIYIYIYI